MGSRGYMLIDFAYPRVLGVASDSIVRFMEYVRQHIREIAPGIPAESEADIFASGHAHNPGRVLPLLGLYFSPHVRSAVPEVWDIVAAVDAWAAKLPDDQVWAIVSATSAPTWAELQSQRTYPSRDGDTEQ